MAIRNVLRMGHPLLNQRAAEVEVFNTPELDRLVGDMLDTMQAEDGAGLAAPQIGISRRIVVFGFDHNPRYEDAPAVPRTVLINPHIRAMDETMEDGWEGCLSVPEFRADVKRAAAITVEGHDRDGNPLKIDAEGILAIVLQHEIDHLNGTLFIEHISALKRQMYKRRVKKQLREK